jgi:hypothetical protein
MDLDRDCVLDSARGRDAGAEAAGMSRGGSLDGPACDAILSLGFVDSQVPMVLDTCEMMC